MLHSMGGRGPQSTSPGIDVELQVAQSCYRCHLGQGSEVSPMPPMSPLPGMPSWLLGITTAREQVVPVVDLARVLGVNSPDRVTGGKSERLLTYKKNGLLVGFLVDDVRGKPDQSLPNLNLWNVADALLDRLRDGLATVTA